MVTKIIVWNMWCGNLYIIMESVGGVKCHQGWITEAYIICMMATKHITQTLNRRPKNMGVQTYGKYIWKPRVFIVLTLCLVPVDTTYPLLRLLTNTTTTGPPPPPPPLWAPKTPRYPTDQENDPEQVNQNLTPPESPTHTVSQQTQTSVTTPTVEVHVSTHTTTVVIRLRL
uniref:E4 protein n=1 Tax=Human papillomavirus 66 TaxID=37119 RepID=A9XCU3_HPV66|nr:putative E4 protein [human papillomavirus 66]ABO76877.1 putative E4 protein [human papillomavirus 66]CAD1814289.1 putative E4 protein [human papillomavirus 66]CAD1814486.1 putative E4 protein [human papillomavirus 66]CAD1814576.1 putative E4 protein [human papillomavirus 66]